MKNVSARSTSKRPCDRRAGRLSSLTRNERKDDLVPDLIEVLASFCAQRYGRRSAKNKAKKAVEAIEDE